MSIWSRATSRSPDAVRVARRSHCLPYRSQTRYRAAACRRAARHDGEPIFQAAVEQQPAPPQTDHAPRRRGRSPPGVGLAALRAALRRRGARARLATGRRGTIPGGVGAADAWARRPSRATWAPGHGRRRTRTVSPRLRRCDERRRGRRPRSTTGPARSRSVKLSSRTAEARPPAGAACPRRAAGTRRPDAKNGSDGGAEGRGHAPRPGLQRRRRRRRPRRRARVGAGRAAPPAPVPDGAAGGPAAALAPGPRAALQPRDDDGGEPARRRDAGHDRRPPAAARRDSAAATAPKASSAVQSTGSAPRGRGCGRSRAAGGAGALVGRERRAPGAGAPDDREQQVDERHRSTAPAAAAAAGPGTPARRGSSRVDLPGEADRRRRQQQAEQHRAGVAHEDPGRVEVVRQEAQAGARPAPRRSVWAADARWCDAAVTEPQDSR